jgi:hypothetical protein
MIATAVLSIAVIGVLMPMISGHRSLRHAELQSRAIRMAESLIDEILLRPYGGGGPTRPEWGLDTYNGFAEQPGSLRDFTGQLCDQEDQVFSRVILVAPASQRLAAFGGPSVAGKSLSVRVDGPDGDSWVLKRFIPAPSTP